MKYLIHLGPHKTGSTYLQLCFKGLRQALAGRGVLVPDIWEHSAGTPSHHGLAERLKQGDFETVAAEIAGLAAPGLHTMLISSEDLSSLNSAAMEGFRRCLGDGEATFVFYIRRWSALVPSSWQEIVKGGSTLTLPEFVLLQLRNPLTTTLLNWQKRLTPVAEAFGHASLRIVCYDLLRQREIDLFTHFARTFLAWPGAQPPAIAAANLSRGSAEVALLRALNAMSERDGIRSGSTLRNAFDRKRGLLGVDAILGAMPPYARTLVFHDDVPPLRQLHDMLFEALQDRLVEPRLPHRLFKPERHDLPYVACDFLGEAGVAAAVRTLHAALCAG